MINEEEKKMNDKKSLVIIPLNYQAVSSHLQDKRDPRKEIKMLKHGSIYSINNNNLNFSNEKLKNLVNIIILF
jgi:hypothetical protein